MQMEHVGSGPDHSAISADPTELLAISKTLPANIEAVLLGYDIHFSFTKQFKAASFLLDSDCQYVSHTPLVDLHFQQSCSVWTNSQSNG